MTTKFCNHETADGNQDDPTLYYCDLPAGHAGEHHYDTE